GFRDRKMLWRRETFPSLAVAAVGWIDGVAWDPAHYRALQQRARSLEASVHIGFPIHRVAEAIAARAPGPRETRFVISQRREVQFEAPGWSMAIPREGTGARLAWVAGSRYEPGHVSALIGALASAGFREVAVHAEGRVRSTIEGDVRRAAERAGTLAARLDGAPIDLAAA